MLFGAASVKNGEAPPTPSPPVLTAPKIAFRADHCQPDVARILARHLAARSTSVREAQDSANTELTRYLTRLMVAANAICANFSGLSPTPGPTRAGRLAHFPDGAYDFPGRCCRRMSADKFGTL